MRTATADRDWIGKTATLFYADLDLYRSDRRRSEKISGTAGTFKKINPKKEWNKMKKMTKKQKEMWLDAAVTAATFWVFVILMFFVGCMFC